MLNETVSLSLGTHPVRKDTVAVLIATAHRVDLLGHRALPSIQHQSRSPDRVIIVDDSRDAVDFERNERVVREWRPASLEVEFLRNLRTKGASGAWNTGLDRLARLCDEPERLWVALLDDADEWDSHHLERCLAAAEEQDLDMVAARFWRIEERADPLMVVPPQSLDLASFLVGNPGIQCSNLVCRLRVLLEAGLFDESLPSSTDRDLCIRIAELPDVRYGITAEPTVNHFACKSRSRLSTPLSPAKIKGLDRFFAKYRGRMSETQREAFRTRAYQHFGLKEPPRNPAKNESIYRCSPSQNSRTSAPRQAPPHLIVGLIADTARLDELSNLLADLRGLSGDPDLSGHDVLIFENGDKQRPDEELRGLVERARKDGLCIRFVDRARHLRDVAQGWVLDGGASRGIRLPIAFARTVLQSYLYAFAKERPGAVVWIIDDDMRLDPLVIEVDGRIRRRAGILGPALRKLHDLHVSGAVDIAIGTCTGAPPVPFAATVRVQLVDLVASLWWLASQDPRAVLPDRSMENAAARSGRRDYYYDLSRDETDRLETPFWITPVFFGESVRAAFERISLRTVRILAGEQIFRPLATKADIDALEGMDEGVQRGGNTFVFDTETLKLAPNLSPIINGRPGRRSDMIWAFMQQNYFGKRVVSVPIALYHDRSHDSTGELDVERIVDDIRGYAVFSALQDTVGVFTPTEDSSVDLVEEMIERFANRMHEHLDDRLAAFSLSFHRIQGLIHVLRRLVNDENAWWHDEEYRTSRERLRSFCDLLTLCYKEGILDRIKCEAGSLSTLQIQEFLEQLPVGIRQHRFRISKLSIYSQNVQKRSKNSG